MTSSSFFGGGMDTLAPCVERDTLDLPRDEERHGPVEDSERIALVDVLKEQVRRGVYRPDVRDLARALASMMVRRP